jgi:hypothetical protein
MMPTLDPHLIDRLARVFAQAAVDELFASELPESFENGQPATDICPRGPREAAQ